MFQLAYLGSKIPREFGAGPSGVRRIPNLNANSTVTYGVHNLSGDLLWGAPVKNRLSWSWDEGMENYVTVVSWQNTCYCGFLMNTMIIIQKCTPCFLCSCTFCSWWWYHHVSCILPCIDIWLRTRGHSATLVVTPKLALWSRGMGDNMANLLLNDFSGITGY
jgi:hypothetical protein